MVYEYKVKGLMKASAQVAGEMCEALEQSAMGLSPRTLLDANREASAPLHDEFEWNDSEAAERFRLNQAATIIRNIVIVRTEQSGTPTPSVRAFVNVRDEAQRSYVGIARAMSDEAMKESLMKSAIRDMDAFKNKYHELQELSSVINAMNPYLTSVTRLNL